MKLIEQVDGTWTDGTATAEYVLRLAARVDRARTEAGRSESGLFEVARDRLLVLALQRPELGLRVDLDPTDPGVVILRPPTGRRAPKATLPLDRVPEALRAALALAVPAPALESVRGLDVGPVDSAVRLRLEGKDAQLCLAFGREAEAEFDYPRAGSAFRLAVLRSRGAIPVVKELVRFLSDVSADYQELVELLASAAIDVEGDRTLHLALADASFALGLDAEALEHYQTLVDRSGTKALERSEVIHAYERLGALLLRAHRSVDAQRPLRKAVELDPGRPEPRRLLEQAERAAAEAEATELGQIQTIIDGGDLARARARLEALRGSSPRPPGAKLPPLAGPVERLSKALEQRERTQKAHEKLTLSAELEREGKLREALAAVKEVAALEPSLAAQANARVESLSAALRADEAARYEGFASERLQAGDRVGAARAMAKALAVRRRPPDEPAPGLFVRLARAMGGKKSWAVPGDKEIEGLVLLEAANDCLEAGDLSAAEGRLRDARRLLKDDPGLGETETRLTRARADRSMTEAQGLVAAAEALEAAGNQKEALAALDRAASVSPELGKTLAARRKELRAQLEGQATALAQRGRFQQLLDAGAVFRLGRALGEFPGTYPDLEAAAQQRIQAEFGVGPVEVNSPKTAGVLEIAEIGLADATSGRVAATIDDQQPRLVLGAGRKLAWFELPSMARVASVQLPESVNVRESTTRLFPSGDRLAIVDAEARRITTLTEQSGAWRVTDHASFDRAVGPGLDPKRLASEAHYDAATHRMLVVLTDQTGRHDSRLLAIDAADGTVVSEERSPAPLFNLRHIHRTPTYTVQRVFDPRRAGGKPFHYGVTDGRARIERRVFLPELEAPMYAIRKIALLPDGGFFVQYWVLDAFSGEPLENGHAFLKVRADHSLFYQNAHTDLWLGDGRHIAGTFERLPDQNAIVLPWRAAIGGGPNVRASRAQKRFRYGLVAVGLERFDRLWEIELPEGQELAALFGHAPAGVVAALINEGGRSRIASLDPARRTLGS